MCIRDSLTGIQLELSAQGLNPRYISMPIAENTANDLFAESYGTKEISDGMEYLTYTYSPREVGENDLAAKSCNAQWTELTGETVEPNTYDYYLVAITCVIVDEVLAALSLAGGDLNRESFIAGIEALPSHHAPGYLGEMDWSPDNRFGPAVFSVHDYDGETNGFTTREDFFELRG